MVRRFPTTVALVAVITLLVAGTAHAVVAPRFGATWKASTTYGTTVTPDVRAIVGFPGGDTRARVRDGYTQWNTVGEPLQYQFNTTDLAYYDPYTACPPKTVAANFWMNIDGGSGTLGLSSRCELTAGSFVSRAGADIIFDSSEEWCYGTGNCYDGFLGTGIGANIDLWSVAAHESGHVSAIGHYDGGSSLCANNESQATMCPSYSPGSERWRSLSSHDIETLRAYY